MKISLATDRVTLGVVRLTGVDVRASHVPPDPQPLPETGIQVARRLYRAIGIDPTKTRPSSEALWRRLQKGKPLPCINTLVDEVNFCSVSLLLPFGAYDAGRIEGDVVLRVGADGEGYEGIGKPWVNVAGRYALCDDAGPFGNPTSDSRRTCVTETTTNALVTIFAPSGEPLDRIDWVAERLRSAAGGSVDTEVLRP